MQYQNIVLISEFGRGKDLFKRKKKDSLKSNVSKGVIAGSATGAGIGILNSLAVSALKKKMGIKGIRPNNPLNDALRSGAMEGAKGAAGGGIIGGIVYKSKKKK